jgi:hypothetical protein
LATQDHQDHQEIQGPLDRLLLDIQDPQDLLVTPDFPELQDQKDHPADQVDQDHQDMESLLDQNL